MRPVIYLAGPYRPVGKWPPSWWQVRLNVRKAAWYASQLAMAGWSPLCPHTNSHLPHRLLWQPRATWLEVGLALLQKADALYLLPRWEESRGAREERCEAKMLGLKCYYWRDGIPEVPE